MAGGYRWWYIDALSDDGKYGLTLIAFIGSVFSPYYFRARRQPTVNPENHCSLNAILYGPGSKHWALTERGHGDLQRSAAQMQVGPSSLRYQGDSLIVDVEEWTVPLPRRLRGQVRVVLRNPQSAAYGLDPAGQHFWQPVAPCAEVEVEFEKPGVSWRGEGYVDANWGSEPLEDGFSYWHWCRAAAPNKETVVRYEAWPRSGDKTLLSLGFDEQGGVRALDNGEAQPLASTPVWRMRRDARVPAHSDVSVTRTYEDTPFYSRSLLQYATGTEKYWAMHESLDLDRFRRPWVQFLLPFRMPRVAR
ncbi:MAG: carotenoid 1,2-hydratase [Pseudomonadota bacterium]